MSQFKPEVTAKIIMQTIDLETATNWVKKFPKHSAVSFTNPLTYPGYKDVPVSYLFCEVDQCIPPDVQQAGIDHIEKEYGNKVHVTRIKGDHCPNFTAPQQSLDWIVDIAQRVESAKA